MTITADELARVMFSARCKKCGISEDDACDFNGEGPELYLELAEQIADFINNHDVEALAVAELLHERQLMNSFFSSLGF